MDQLQEQMQLQQQQLALVLQKLEEITDENRQLRAKSQQADDALKQMETTLHERATFSGGANPTNVSKWPSPFYGQEVQWPTFKTKFIGYVSCFPGGHMNDWLNHVDLK